MRKLIKIDFNKYDINDIKFANILKHFDFDVISDDNDIIIDLEENIFRLETNSLIIDLFKESNLYFLIINLFDKEGHFAEDIHQESYDIKNIRNILNKYLIKDIRYKKINNLI